MEIFTSDMTMSPVMALAVELAARQVPLSCAEPRGAKASARHNAALSRIVPFMIRACHPCRGWSNRMGDPIRFCDARSSGTPGQAELPETTHQRRGAGHSQMYGVAFVLAVVDHHAGFDGSQRSSFLLRNPQLRLDQGIRV